MRSTVTCTKPWNNEIIATTCRGASLGLLRAALEDLLAARVLEQLRVHVVRRQLHVAHDGAADEAVLHGEHVRMALRVRHRDVVELHVEVLVHRVQRSADAETDG